METLRLESTSCDILNPNAPRRRGSHLGAEVEAAERNLGGLMFTEAAQLHQGQRNTLAN